MDHTSLYIEEPRWCSRTPPKKTHRVSCTSRASIPASLAWIPNPHPPIGDPLPHPPLVIRPAPDPIPRRRCPAPPLSHAPAPPAAAPVNTRHWNVPNGDGVDRLPGRAPTRFLPVTAPPPAFLSGRPQRAPPSATTGSTASWVARPRVSLRRPPRRPRSPLSGRSAPRPPSGHQPPASGQLHYRRWAPLPLSPTSLIAPEQDPGSTTRPATHGGACVFSAHALLFFLMQKAMVKFMVRTGCVLPHGQSSSGDVGDRWSPNRVV